MFGGLIYYPKTSSTIARLDEVTREWSKLGKLLTARFRGRTKLFIKCLLKLRQMKIFFQKNFRSSPHQNRTRGNPHRAVLFGNRWSYGYVGHEWVQADSHGEVYNE